MAQLAQQATTSTRQGQGVATSISERLSQELVIALVGPVGSGVTSAANYVREILVQDFGYDVAPTIKPSEIIRKECHRIGMAVPSKTPLSQYITDMQTAGNELRKKFGADYLAEKAVEQIFRYRHDRGAYVEHDGKQIQIPGRRAYVIDSIKNMEELTLLRQIYSDSMCLIGVFAPDKVRFQRLIDEGVDEPEVQKILDRDQGEVMTFGQMTRKIFVESDLFICNDQKLEELRRKVTRYIQLLFDSQIHTPTRAESAMYEANSVAPKSACMSRQVGAAIISNSGELIAVGWNDVPRFGGGLYVEDDQAVWDVALKSVQDKDHRCFKHGRKICHNETRRTKILDDIATKIALSGLLKKGADYKVVRELLAGTAIDSLTEFSRSIHAEMEAILSVAREGRHSLVGATLFTTTYPCHNCARHIVAAGIARVIYIEPYKKSLATVLHDDAVTEDVNDATRVVFSQYDGVAPSRYLQVFRPTRPRKENGRLSITNAAELTPIFQIPLDSPMDYESIIIANLSDKEDNLVPAESGL